MGLIEKKGPKVPLEGCMEIRNWKSGKIGQILSGGRQEEKKSKSRAFATRAKNGIFWGNTTNVFQESQVNDYAFKTIGQESITTKANKVYIPTFTLCQFVG